MPILLHNKDTGAPIGEITDAQLQLLIEVLEEENTKDKDYYIDSNTLDLLAEEGADAALLALLRPHVLANGGEDDGIEVEWKKT